MNRDTSPMSILLVEDNRADARLVQRYLDQIETPRVNVTWCGLFAEAMIALNKQNFDAVLLDLHLPDGDYPGSLEKILAEAPEMPVVLMTAQDELSPSLGAVQHGAQDHLVKSSLTGGSLVRSLRYAIDRKRGEVALRRSEERLRLAYRCAHAASWEWDLGTGTITGSPELFDLLGIGHDFSLNFESWIALIHPDDRPDAERAIRDIAQLGHESRVEFRVQRTGETPRWLACVGGGVHTAAGRPARAAGILLDVTQQRLAEIAARDADLVYRAIGESIDFGVWTCDADGRITYVSPSLLRLVGMTMEQAAGDGLLSALHPDEVEPTRLAWNRCVRTGGLWDVEHRFRGTDGEYHPTLARGVPIRDTSGRIVRWAGINLDIGRLKRTQQELRDLTAQLEKRVAERTAVAEQRAQQLRVLLSELSNAEQRERRRLSQVLHDHLQQLLVAAKMKLTVGGGVPESVVRDVDNLLSQAIAESRSLTLQLSPPILHDRGLVPAMEWLARRFEQEHGLHVEVHAAPGVADPGPDAAGFLFQAARELLFNTTKHAGTDRAQLALDRPTPGEIRLTVRDEGAGFDASRAVAPAEHFGLFSIRQRVELMSGSATVESRPGAGTTVSLTLPAAPGAAAPPPDTDAAHAAAAAAPRQPGTIRVLVADDHKLLRDGVTAILARYPDVQIVGEACDGEAAVESARRLDPDVVLMDMTMPRLDGVEATRRITAQMPHVRVIGLSMHGDEEVAREMRQAGAADYLTKGGPSDQLIAAIRRAAGETHATV